MKTAKEMRELTEIAEKMKRAIEVSEQLASIETEIESCKSNGEYSTEFYQLLNENRRHLKQLGYKVRTLLLISEYSRVSWK